MHTRKTIYLLNIGNYLPEVTALTYPRIFAYAERIGAEVFTIKKRVFPQWPITYEKLQIHHLAQEHNVDWAIYIDSDALLHPELPDVTELIPRDYVAHNGNDWSPIRFDLDDYFRRDGRHIGSCNWFTVASSWCLDLWRPLDDLTPDEAQARIHLTVPESKIMKAEHLIDDYALSRNIARFGLKFTTLNQIFGSRFTEWNFFFHEYLISPEEKVAKMRAQIKLWDNPSAATTPASLQARITELEETLGIGQPASLLVENPQGYAPPYGHKRGFNPVSNPNPDVSKARLPTGVQSQGYDGGIRPYLGDPNVRYCDGPEYGEDLCLNNPSDKDETA